MSKKAGKNPPANPFRVAVDATPEIAECYQAGLQALRASDKAKIELGDTRKCLGSVDIDTCVAANRPHESRWDYVLGYQPEAHFVEVHGAQTSDVDTVLKKLAWLKKWLAEDAPALDAMKAEHCFHWVASGRIDILPTMPQYRRAASAGLLPKSMLKLP
ncbi:MAG: hypothetical protein ACK4Q5_20070 [Saprospiraceae bacterium]